MYRGSWIPLEAHGVAQNWLVGWLGGLATAVLVVVNQCRFDTPINVVRQSQHLAVPVFHLKFQEVTTAMGAVSTLHHIHHTHQREQAAGAQMKINMLT